VPAARRIYPASRFALGVRAAPGEARLARLPGLSARAGLQLTILEGLLASVHRTMDAEAADFFYVPVSPDCILERGPHASPALDMASAQLLSPSLARMAFLFSLTRGPWCSSRRSVQKGCWSARTVLTKRPSMRSCLCLGDRRLCRTIGRTTRRSCTGVPCGTWPACTPTSTGAGAATTSGSSGGRGLLHRAQGGGAGHPAGALGQHGAAPTPGPAAPSPRTSRDPQEPCFDPRKDIVSAGLDRPPLAQQHLCAQVPPCPALPCPALPCPFSRPCFCSSHQLPWQASTCHRRSYIASASRSLLPQGRKYGQESSPGCGLGAVWWQLLACRSSLASDSAAAPAMRFCRATDERKILFYFSGNLGAAFTPGRPERRVSA